MESKKFRIEHYEFGKIVIDRQTYSKDLLITPEGIIEKWWRKEGHGLYPEDLTKVMHLNPKTLIIGTGSPGRLKVPDATREWLDSLGVVLIEIPTSEACAHYNQIDDPEGVVAGLHLTC